jgi:hypothetical protein
MLKEMNMATKVMAVQDFCTSGEIKSCINDKGQWHEPACNFVLLKAYCRKANETLKHVGVELLSNSHHGWAWVVRAPGDEPILICWWNDGDPDAFLMEAIKFAKEADANLEADLDYYEEPIDFEWLKENTDFLTPNGDE